MYQSFNIEGFYDNIDILEMEKILKTLIPTTFKSSNRKQIKQKSRILTHTIKHTNSQSHLLFFHIIKATPHNPSQQDPL
jgi:hypothetical protein